MLWLAALALLPLLVKVGQALLWTTEGLPPISVDGDDAVLELYVRQAGRGEQLLGPYSRLGWNHPGPTYFYLLLPVYELFGRHALGIHWGALLINLASALGALAVAGRLGGTRLVAPVAAALAIHVALFGAARISHPWNPFVTLMPFGLYLVVGAALAHRRGWALPAAVALGSFLVQTHLGLLPPVASVLLIAAVAGRADLTLGSVGWAVAVAAALWALPLADQVGGAPGNLGLIGRFLIAGEPGLGLAAGVREAPARLASGLIDGAPAAPLSLALVGLLGAGAWRARGTAAGALALVCLVATATAPFAIAQVRGEYFDYLVGWAGVAGLFAGAAAWATSAPARWSAALAPVVVVAVAVALGQLAAGGRPEPGRVSERVEALARAALSETTDGRPLLRTAGPEQWRFAAGLALRFDRAGRPLAIAEPEWRVFGQRFEPTGHEEIDLLLDRAPPDPRTGYQVVAAIDDVALMRREP